MVKRFFKALQRAFARPAGEAAPTHLRWLFVRCAKCGTIFRVGVNVQTDVMNNYADPNSDIPAYSLKKDAMDSRCFNPIRIAIHYDHQMREINREIQGGEFTTQEQYEAALTNQK
jgi:hypothetical protein